MKKVILASLLATTALSGCANMAYKYEQKRLDEFVERRKLTLPTRQEYQDIIQRAQTQTIEQKVGNSTYHWLPAGKKGDLKTYFVDVNTSHKNRTNTASAFTKTVEKDGSFSIAINKVFCFDGYGDEMLMDKYRADGTKKFSLDATLPAKGQYDDRPIANYESIRSKTICALGGFSEDSSVVYQPNFGKALIKRQGYIEPPKN